MYVYIFCSKSENYLVGFYNPNDEFYVESTYNVAADAAARTSYLNGGKKAY